MSSLAFTDFVVPKRSELELDIRRYVDAGSSRAALGLLAFVTETVERKTKRLARAKRAPDQGPFSGGSPMA